MKCEKCGFTPNPGDQICMKCGSKLSFKNAVMPGLEEIELGTTKNNKPKIGIYITGILFVIIIIFVIIFLVLK